MRRAILQAALITGVSAAAPALAAEKRVQDKRLVGAWQSDREKTLELWRFKPNIEPSNRERVANMFGRLTLRYAQGRVCSEFDGHQTDQPYRVVASDTRSVVVEYKDESGPVLEQLFFEGEYLYKFTGYNIEFFRRIKT